MCHQRWKPRGCRCGAAAVRRQTEMLRELRGSESGRKPGPAGGPEGCRHQGGVKTKWNIPFQSLMPRVQQQLAHFWAEASINWPSMIKFLQELPANNVSGNKYFATNLEIKKNKNKVNNLVWKNAPALSRPGRGSHGGRRRCWVAPSIVSPADGLGPLYTADWVGFIPVLWSHGCTEVISYMSGLNFRVEVQDVSQEPKQK